MKNHVEITELRPGVRVVLKSTAREGVIVEPPEGKAVELGRTWVDLGQGPEQVLDADLDVSSQSSEANTPAQADLPEKDVCEECGCSLRPLPIPHTKRPCQKCEKVTYVCEAGEKGGIVVRPGDQFMIPAGYIKVSLDPSSSGVLTQHGIPWLVQHLFSSGEVNSQDEVGKTLDEYAAEADQYLKSSQLLRRFDLSDEAHAAEVWSLLEQNRGKPEWWAACVSVLAREARRALEAGDAPRTAWVMSKIATCRAMLLFHRDLEQHVWRGYVAGRLRNVLGLWRANENNDDEEFWQRTMADNVFILSQLFSFPTVILKGKAYIGGKGLDNTGAKLLDFLIANQLGNNTALVEIKTPRTLLLGREYRDGVFPPSTELAGAVTQVLVYKDTFMKDYHSLASRSGQDFNAFDPPCMVIAGDFRTAATTRERHASLDLFRNSLKGVQVVTYDEVFKKVEGLLALLGD